MVIGLLITSVTSGQLISRRGRYKVFPIIGTGLLTVALFLLSRLNEHTPTAVMWLYFLLLGLALGLILQVLIIAVQNSADYADLGSATSGATFFRSIGGSFGVAIFGAVFSNRLATEIVAELRGVRLPPGFNPAAAQANPVLIHRLPAAVRGDVMHAYTLSLQTVFLAAVPVALVAFVLSWFLREVPLRQAVGAAANPADVADGLGATSAQRSSADELERALVQLSSTDLRRRGYERMAEMSGLGLPAGSCWVLTHLAKRDPVARAGTGPGGRRHHGAAGGRTWTSWSSGGWSPGRTACCTSPAPGARRRTGCSPRGTTCWRTWSPTGHRSSTPRWPSCSAGCPARCSARTLTAACSPARYPALR